MLTINPPTSSKDTAMQCPNCLDVNLAMTDRQGVEIDYCPQCRGVWLDRGELDKLIERAGSEATPQRSQPQHSQPQHSQPQHSQPQHSQPQHSYPNDWQRRKQKSWLSDIFD